LGLGGGGGGGWLKREVVVGDESTKLCRQHPQGQQGVK